MFRLLLNLKWFGLVIHYCGAPVSSPLDGVECAKLPRGIDVDAVISNDHCVGNLEMSRRVGSLRLRK